MKHYLIRNIITLLILLSVGTVSHGQMNTSNYRPHELNGVFSRLIDGMRSFQTELETEIENSNDVFYNGDTLTEDQINKRVTNLLGAQKEFNEEAKELRIDLENDISFLTKKKPHISQKDAQLIEYLNRTMIFLDSIEIQFSAFVKTELDQLRDNYGQKELNRPKLKNLLVDGSSFTEGFWDYAHPLERSGLFDMCCSLEFIKFLKKNKLVHIRGEFDDNSDNEYETFVFKYTKNNKMGLYELWSDYSIKNILIPAEFDTIIYNRNAPVRVEHFSGIFIAAETWTIAIGYNFGGSNRVYLRSLKPDANCNPCEEEHFNLKQITIPFDSIFFPKEESSITTFIGAKNNSRYFLYNPFEDSIISPKFDRLDYLWLKSSEKELSDGTELQYDNGGNIRLIKTIDNHNSTTNLIKGYRRNGSLQFEYKEKDAKIQDSVFYYDENEKLSSIDIYKLIHDTLNYVELYPNLLPKTIGNYLVEGKTFGFRYDSDFKKNFYWTGQNKTKIGKWKSYYSNGQLRKEEIYRIDKYGRAYLHGQFVSNYLNGDPKSIGNYITDSLDNSIKDVGWEYYNPFGEKCDEFYKPIRSIEFKFPGRIFEDTNYYVVYSSEFKRAILFSERYSPNIYELWDTKHNLLLESDLKIDISLRGGDAGFISPTKIWGYSLYWDGPEGYDLTNNKIIAHNGTGNFEWTERLSSFKHLDEFNPKELPVARKVSFNKTNLKGGLLHLGSKNANFQMDLSSGTLSSFKGNILNQIDSIWTDVQNKPGRVYAAELSNSNEDLAGLFEKDLKRLWHYTKGTPDSLNIYINYYYDQGKIMFENQKKKGVEQFVFMEVNENGTYVLRSLDNYYMGSKELKNVCYFSFLGKPYLGSRPNYGEKSG